MIKHLEKLLHGCERAAAAGNIPVSTERTEDSEHCTE